MLDLGWRRFPDTLGRQHVARTASESMMFVIARADQVPRPPADVHLAAASRAGALFVRPGTALRLFHGNSPSDRPARTRAAFFCPRRPGECPSRPHRQAYARLANISEQFCTLLWASGCIMMPRLADVR